MPIIINPTLPNILTNGTIADATQVMADFASIISQVNANAAENGANSSITSLSGLTTPLTVAQGGTGIANFGQGVLMYGQGTTAIGQIAAVAAGQMLVSTAINSAPQWVTYATVLTSANLVAGLGFTPVQQGTGISQGSNVVKLGWYTGSGNGLLATVDTTQQGFFVFSSTNAAGGYTIAAATNFSGGVSDNGNRVWSPGNYQPFTDNGIGWDTLYGTAGGEGTTTTISGRPGTWIYLSGAQTGAPLYLVRRIA